MGIFVQDLRFAFRMLRKSPSFTVAAILTLAVAIGANAVVFGALNALVLRPLNVPHAESMYELGRANGQNESYPSYLDLRDRNRSFESLAAEAFDQVGLDTGQGPALSWGYSTSGNYFDVLGIQPYLGRLFHAADEHGANSAPYVVLSYAYWHTHFDDDRRVAGRVVQLNKHPFTIIGVTPPGFVGILVGFSPDFFVPIVSQQEPGEHNLLNARGNHWIDFVLGHLKPGVTPAQATADLNSIGAYLVRNYPKEETDGSFGIGHAGGFGDIFNGAVKAFLAGLMLLAGLILLAACANLGSLFTARAAERSREVALRLALGSSRQRILRGLFSEALLVSLAGGGLGLWGSVMLMRWLSAWHPFPEFPIHVPVSPDAHVYGVALLLALVSGLLFGAIPVRQVLRTDPYEIIKSGARSTRGRQIGVRDLLLGLQIALCAVLVTSSLVALRGLLRSLHTHLGIEPQNAMLVSTDLATAGYRHSEIPGMQKRMTDATATIPGVTAVGLVGEDPPLHMGWQRANVFTDRTSDFRPSNAAAVAISYNISPEYFQAAGTGLLLGRNFTWHDGQNAPRVAIVNQVFARKIFGSPAQSIG
ncbi:MAG TPA: ABC transporter permease, partial [Terriglobales bacterium]|nr:ABC transporter permease [Terriglobales bacterium]